MWAQRRRLCAFVSSDTLLRPARGLLLGARHCCRSPSGPAPRRQSPGTPWVSPRSPSLPACVCSPGPHSITSEVRRRPGWRRLRWPWGAAACCPASPALHRGSTPPLPCCLCTCWTRRQTHTNPQLSTELERGFLEISTRESPFLGFICSVSGLPVRHLTVPSPAFQFLFPGVFLPLSVKTHSDLLSR